MVPDITVQPLVQQIEPARSYRDTLRRHPDPGQPMTEAWRLEHLHGVPFLPEAMSSVQQAMLDETGCVTVRLETAFSAIQARDGRIEHVHLSDGSCVTGQHGLAIFWGNG